MKPARLIILAVAIGTAGLAGVLAMRLTATPAPVSEGAVEQVSPAEQKVNVLVASGNLAVGSRLNSGGMKWVAWPETGVQTGFITDQTNPEAMTELDKAVVRMPIFDGEPIRREKLADGSGRIMSALLPSGKRAVATEISVATGAGGFILPNDRVDVIMVRRDSTDNYVTETVLSNIRVLAIDQQIEEKEDGGQAVVGTTATLELTPDQSRVMTVAQQMAQRLTLALRSVADAQEPDTDAPSYLLNGGSESAGIQVIKSGTIIKSTSSAAE